MKFQGASGFNEIIQVYSFKKMYASYLRQPNRNVTEHRLLTLRGYPGIPTPATVSNYKCKGFVDAESRVRCTDETVLGLNRGHDESYVRVSSLRASKILGGSVARISFDLL